MPARRRGRLKRLRLIDLIGDLRRRADVEAGRRETSMFFDVPTRRPSARRDQSLREAQR